MLAKDGADGQRRIHSAIVVMYVSIDKNANILYLSHSINYLRLLYKSIEEME
jgi:hypothetical protein